MMRILKESRVREYAKHHALAASPLQRWLEISKAANWKTPEDVRKSWKSADFVRVQSGHTVTIFHIGGTNFQLITAVRYDLQKVFVLRFYTHAEYSRNDWKNEL